MLLNVTSVFTPESVVGESWSDYLFRYLWAVVSGNGHLLFFWLMRTLFVSWKILLVLVVCLCILMFIIGMLLTYEFPRHTTLWKVCNVCHQLPSDTTGNLWRATKDVITKLYHCLPTIVAFFYFWVQFAYVLIVVVIVTFMWFFMGMLYAFAMFYGLFVRNPNAPRPSVTLNKSLQSIEKNLKDFGVSTPAEVLQTIHALMGVTKSRQEAIERYKEFMNLVIPQLESRSNTEAYLLHINGLKDFCMNSCYSIVEDNESTDANVPPPATPIPVSKKGKRSAIVDEITTAST